jgi:hypothetical protein
MKQHDIAATFSTQVKKRAMQMTGVVVYFGSIVISAKQIKFQERFTF